MAKKTLFDKLSMHRTILTPEQLEQIDRDLSFQSASLQAARTLTPQQIEAFNRDGHLMPLPIFDAEEMLEQRAFFEELAGEAEAAGYDPYSLIDTHLTHRRAYDLMFEPRLVSRVVDLIGENVVCWTNHYFCKMPHDKKTVAWHQDAYYWPYTPSRAVSVWLAIDNVDAENACMQYVSGSHLQGKIPHRISREEEKNVLRFTVDGIEGFGRIEDVALNSGEISLHSDLLLHGSGANHSDRRRCGLTLRYLAADVHAYMDWSQTGVLICGEDRRNHWGNPPRPDRD